MVQRPFNNPMILEKKNINLNFSQLTISWKQLQLIKNKLVTLINRT